MQARIDEEINLLRKTYPNLEYAVSGHWVRIPDYKLPPGWNRDKVDAAFQIPPSYPGTHPYGIYVPAGLRFGDQMPNNFTEPAKNSPPFGGTWAVFSWQPACWKPKAAVSVGDNLWSWVMGFSQRFREGR